MAKPGSSAARRVANGGVVDLRAASMTDDEARQAQEALELQMGARCSGCGRRITIGMRFTSIDVRDPQRPVMELSACTREDCDFVERAREGATLMKMVEFAWPDASGPDAPPATVVVERNKRRERAAEGPVAD